MSPIVIRFLMSSLVFFVLGAGAGLAMLLPRGFAAQDFVTAHAHLNLLGFVCMMIYGVAYHVLPRFMGKAQPHSLALAHWQWWLATLSLLALAGLWVTVSYQGNRPLLSNLLLAAGAVQAIAILMFVINIYLTIAIKPQEA